MSSSKYQVRLLSVAEQDLLELISYVASDNPDAALQLAERIETQLGNLVRHPYLGKIPNDQTLASLGYRVLVVENYLIFYKVRRRTVLVHRIIHGARDITSLLTDL